MYVKQGNVASNYLDKEGCSAVNKNDYLGSINIANYKAMDASVSLALVTFKNGTYDKTDGYPIYND